MQYTSNYNLMLPEGTDVVNLLTQLNPNISDIDAAMFANKKSAVGRATELTAGTVHGITRANTDSPVFAFTATSNWTAGDSMTVDGVAVSVFLSDGTTPDTGAYVINSEVLAIIQGSRVTLLSSRGGVDASDVAYYHTASGLSATNTQDAIDEVQAEVAALDLVKIKNGTKTATTDSAGNVSVMPGAYTLVAVKISGTSPCKSIPFYYSDHDAWYATVTNFGGAPVANESVTITYYYI